MHLQAALLDEGLEGWSVAMQSATIASADREGTARPSAVVIAVLIPALVFAASLAVILGARSPFMKRQAKRLLRVGSLRIQIV